MDIALIDNAAMSRGAWLPVELPEALRETGPVRIKLRSTDADEARRPLADHQRRIAKIRAEDGPNAPAEIADSEAQLYAALTVEWEGVLSGGVIWPCTAENAHQLYRTQKWLAKQVRLFVFSDDPFVTVLPSTS